MNNFRKIPVNFMKKNSENKESQLHDDINIDDVFHKALINQETKNKSKDEDNIAEDKDINLEIHETLRHEQEDKKYNNGKIFNKIKKIKKTNKNTLPNIKIVNISKFIMNIFRKIIIFIKKQPLITGFFLILLLFIFNIGNINKLIILNQIEAQEKEIVSIENNIKSVNNQYMIEINLLEEEIQFLQDELENYNQMKKNELVENENKLLELNDKLKKSIEL